MKIRRYPLALTVLWALLSGGYTAEVQAQIDLSGSWDLQLFQDYLIRRPGPNYDDYAGVPLNANARAAALSYSPESITQYDRSCEPWPVHYIFLGPFGIGIWSTLDPASGAVVAWNISGWVDRMPITIWMDGRAHPPALAQHTPAGFTTGEWQGDTLVTHTTHISDGYLTRNGVPSSNQEALTMFISRHDQLLTMTGVVHDPVYLTAPYVLARSWKYNPEHLEDMGGLPIARPMNCLPEEEVPGLSDGYHVATILPGHDDLLQLMLKDYHLPREAVLGGQNTMYPDFQKHLSSYSAPAECTHGCCGWGNGGPAEFGVAARLQCKGGNF